MYVIHDRFMKHYLNDNGDSGRTFYISNALRFNTRQEAWSWIKQRYSGKQYRFFEVQKLT